MILPQHAGSCFIDCHNAAILIDKNYPFIEIVKNLLQFRQSNHKCLSLQKTLTTGDTNVFI